MKKKIYVQFLMLLLLSSVVIAPTAVEFSDPGTTPDSVWYGLELFWEGVAEAGEDHTLERFSEMHAMIVEGNNDAAGEAANHLVNYLESQQQSVQEISTSGTSQENIDETHDYEMQTFTYEDYHDALVEGLSDETLEETGLNAIEEAIVEEQAVIEEQQEEIIEAIAEEEGSTELEVELRVEEQEEASGLAERHQEEVTEDLAEVQQQLEQVEADLVQAVAEGQEVPQAATELIAEAHARLEESQNALTEGRFGESFGQFTAAEHLLDNAERFLDGEVSGEELTELVESTQEQRIEDEQQYVDEYEENVDDWTEEFPEYADDYDDWYEQGQKAVELANALSAGYTQQSAQLLAEGKTEAEIFQIISDRFVAEYERVYGETYLPPVFEVNPDFALDQGIDPGSVYDPSLFSRGITDVGSLPADALDTKGGFVEGYTYTDPVTGYTYSFTENGYTYTTPLGLKYEESFPDGYSFPAAYEKGNEQHSYTHETPEGTVTYNYFATGYEVTLPDGKTETYSYPEGGYDVVGGGFFEHSATGFDFRHEGELNHYDYNPVYDTFIGSDGNSYRPDAYFQSEEFNYDYSNQVYEYDHEGETWSFDPGANTWTSSTGETHTPGAYVIAPVGHENEGEYTTETGESWTYNPAAAAWESATGAYHSDGTWESNSGTSYNFDHESGQFLDPSTGEQAQGIVYSGTTWNYDSSANTWSSSTGQVVSGPSYAPPTGVGGYEGGHVDSAGHAGSYDAGSYSGSYSGGYTGGDAGTGGTAPSGGYSAPSGGDAGGSAPSGGDAGGSAPSGDGGGHSDGGTGHVVRQPYTAEELHPVTKWIYKYLGVRS